MFIDPGERVIIMQDALSPFTAEECRSLAGAGIRSVYMQGAVRWGDMQPSPIAPVNWSGLDREVEKFVKAGLRVLLPQLYQSPAWKPDEWFLRKTANGLPSMTNPKTADDITEWTGKLIQRYGSPQVQVVYSIVENGEFPDSDWPTSHHPYPDEAIVAFVMGQMRQLAAQFGEVWTAFHHYGNPPYIDPLYSALVAEYPDCKHYSIQFTHFVHGWGGQAPAVIRAREVYGIRTFGGSEYCGGMVRYLPEAISQKVGYLTCPNHSFQPERRLTPEMTAIIAQTVRAMEAADYA